VVLSAIKDSEEKRNTFLSKSNRPIELFELLLKNWEFPIK